MKCGLHGGDIYRHPGLLDFSCNIHPLGAPEGVKKAAAQAMEQIAAYPDQECQLLLAALAEQEGLPKEQIILGNGAAELCFLVAFAQRPKKALLLVPGFAEYERALRAVGCQISFEELKREQDFALTEEILTKLNPDLDMLFLCNPNNPTGRLIEATLLERIVQICRERKILLVIDECFLDFADQELSMKGALQENPQLLLLKAFTKLYGMAGLRLGYALSANRELLQKMEEMAQPWNISLPAQAAGVAALKEREHVRIGREIVQKEKAYLQKELMDMGYQLYPSDANYLLFEGAEDLYEKALLAGFLLRDCSNYRGLRKGDYRIAVKTHEDNERLIRWLKQL